MACGPVKILYADEHVFLLKNGADDVKRHRWFRTVDWEAVPQRKLKVRLPAPGDA